MATGAVLMFRGAGASMRRVLAVGTTVGAVRTVVPLMTFLVTVVTDNRARRWIQGWWASGVGSHGPMTVVIEVTIVAAGASSTKTDSGGRSTV